MSLFRPTRRALLAGAALSSVVPASPLFAQESSVQALAEAFTALFNPSASAADRAAFWRDRLSEGGRERWPLEAFQTDIRGVADMTGGLDLLDVRHVSDGPRAQLSFRLRSRSSGVARSLRLGPDRDDPSRLFVVPDIPYPALYDQDGVTGPVSRARLAQEIERRVRYAVEQDEFSGTVLVTDPEGKTLWQGAFGTADRAAGRPITLDTPFHLGSSDKSFTALMIGRLIREGRLDLNTPLINVLPDYPNATFARACTIDHLLTHTSGLGGLFDRPGYDRLAPHETMAGLFPAFAAEAPAFQPGARAEYSNEGFVVLGAVLERVTGRNWYDLLGDQIYAPVGMPDSAHLKRDEATERKAKGYTFPQTDRFGLGERVENDLIVGYRGNSCGGGYSTVQDMTRYLRALRAGRLMPAEQLTAFVTTRPGGLWDYGRGFQVRSTGGRTLVGHGGGGARSGIDGDHFTVWETGWTLSILGNYDAPFTGDMARDLGRWLAVQDG